MKRLWRMAVIVGGLIIFTGCGIDRSKEQQEPVPSPLQLEVSTTYQEEAKQVEAKVFLTNQQERAVQVRFNTSQRFQLTIQSEAGIVFDYGQEYFFTQALIEETWEPGERQMFTETFDLPLEPGTYTVEVVSLAQVEGAPEIAVVGRDTIVVKDE